MAFHDAGLHQSVHHSAALVPVPAHAAVQHPLVAEHAVRQLSRGKRACARGRAGVVCVPPAGPDVQHRLRFYLGPPPEGPDPSFDLAFARRNTGGDQSKGIHSNGMHTCPLEWTASWNGLVSNALESIAYQCNSFPATAPSRHAPGERDKESRGPFTTIRVTPQITRR